MSTHSSKCSRDLRGDDSLLYANEMAGGRGPQTAWAQVQGSFALLNTEVPGEWPIQWPCVSLSPAHSLVSSVTPFMTHG